MQISSGIKIRFVTCRFIRSIPAVIYLLLSVYTLMVLKTPKPLPPVASATPGI